MKNKKLFNKLCKIKAELIHIKDHDLQFQSQEMETQRSLFRAIDELRACIDNIS